VQRGGIKDPIKIAARADRKRNRYKMGRFFEVEIEEGHFSFRLKEEELKKQQLLAGMYVLKTSTSSETLSAEEAQQSYKGLAKVEQDFRILKSSLKVRPIYHWTKNRIKAHVFVCFLALWLEHHFEKRLQSLWENHTRSEIESELIQLKMIYLSPKDIFTQPILTKPTPLQKQIFKHLEFSIPRIE